MLKGLLNVTREKISEITDEPDSEYYGRAEQEINDGTFDKGLWAKALVAAEGKEELRKVEYIKFRAIHLQKNAEKLQKEQLQREAEKLQAEKLQKEQQQRQQAASLRTVQFGFVICSNCAQETKAYYAYCQYCLHTLPKTPTSTNS